MTDGIISVAIHHLEKAAGGAYRVHAGNGDLAIGNTAKRLIDDLHRQWPSRRA